MKSLSKTEAQKQLDLFFQRPFWSPEELRKLRRLAMKYRIRLGPQRKSFCKSCLFPLKGKIRITRTHKTVVCEKCGAINSHSM